MQPVMLQKLEIGGGAIEEERINKNVIFRRKVGIDAFERSPVFRPEIWRRAHAAEQHSDMTRGETAQDGVERVARHLRLETAQHVVCAKLENERLCALRYRPVEPGKTIRGGIA